MFNEVKKMLSSQEMVKVETLYLELKSSKGLERLNSSIKLMTDKLEMLDLSDNRYQREVLHITKALLDVTIKSKACDQKSKRLALIGLAYLCDPFDVVPDHNTERGYADDIYMYSLVLKDIKINSEMTHKAFILAHKKYRESD